MNRFGIPNVRSMKPFGIPNVKSMKPFGIPNVKSMKPFCIPNVKSMKTFGIPNVKSMNPFFFNIICMECSLESHEPNWKKWYSSSKLLAHPGRILAENFTKYKKHTKY